ncbi:STAS domain-containing protein [Streptomyces sp. PvR034]|uniref:STAS domain-containing protein n=1 Tax=Streptomyces sp. PvR034 TaxID=3156401 RepID=UPI0033981083
MTTSPTTPLRLSHHYADGVVGVELHGDLDHRHAALLVDAVRRALAEHAGPDEVRVDCAGLTTVDSTGLAALLMVRRHTDAAGVALHLEGRTTQLDRLLRLTGTLGHFTHSRPGAQPGTGPLETRPGEEQPPARSPDPGA